MAPKRPIRGNRPEGGAAAVEFALIMPILVLLISGIVGFGVVFAQQLALGNAARQVARSAVVDGSFCGSGGAAGTALASTTMLTRDAKDNSNTIFMTKTNVGVEIKRAATAPPTTPWTGLCTGDSGDAAKACKGSALGDNVYVRLRYTSTLSLPFFRPSFNLSATGAFRCEYQ